MICAGVGAVMLVAALGLASRMPEWAKIFLWWEIAGAVACCVAGLACGIVGLAQRQRRHESAAMGLFWNTCILVVFSYVLMHG